MTEDEVPRSPADEIEGLNAALRGEISAVKAYEKALRSTKGEVGVDRQKFLHFASEHQRTVTALEGAIREMGGVPTSKGATGGAFVLVRESASVHKIFDEEEAALTIYEAACRTLDGNTLDLVRFDLIPRQKKIIAELAAIILRLGA